MTEFLTAPALSGMPLAVMDACIRELVRRGGPDIPEWPAFDALAAEIYRRHCCGQLAPEELSRLRAAFGEVFSPETVPGHIITKPHGYPGDFEIIDRIYRVQVTANPLLRNWDRYCLTRPVARAVRNRKLYFRRMLRYQSLLREGRLEVLNLASGPGRDMLEHFQEHGPGRVHIDCLEQDPAAVAYAERLCGGYPEAVRFITGNALAFKPDKQYHFIWSAGLFDYFPDAVFRRLLRRLLPAVAPGGQLVIGNFSEANPNRGLMHLLDWELHYRSPDRLVDLAVRCGVPRERVSIGREPEGINLFLHIQG